MHAKRMLMKEEILMKNAMRMLMKRMLIEMLMKNADEEEILMKRNTDENACEGGC
jgi:hypothetical protein